MLVHGGCRCGSVSFELAWQPDPLEIPARACSCSFCRKHGGVWTSTPAGSLTVRVRNAAHLSSYEFATRTAQFRVCSHCGVVPLVTSRIQERLYAVVNVNVLEGIDSTLLRTVAATLEGESLATRLQRRQQNWIPDVVFRDGT